MAPDQENKDSELENLPQEDQKTIQGIVDNLKKDNSVGDQKQQNQQQNLPQKEEEGQER